MKHSSLPLYCPHCLGTDVSFTGYDAAAKRQGKERLVYKCQSPSCGMTFTNETLERHEAAERAKD